MVSDIDERRLDDRSAQEAFDPSGMLRAAATGGAQLREAYAVAAAAGLDAVVAGDRPRAIVICAMGGSATGADITAGLIGPAGTIPVVVNRSERLPGWVGAADLVVGVSCSGRTGETLSAVAEARRRSARLLGIGSADSPLADLITSGRGTFVGIRPVLAPRATMWALTVPLLALAAGFGLCDVGPATPGELPADLEAAAVALEQAAIACRPDSESFVNPAKGLALGLAGALPMVWGSGRTTGPAATRFVCQLAENAKTPAIAGASPEALHNQIVCFDGVESGAGDDIFRDRTEDDRQGGLHLVLIRDDETDTADAGEQPEGPERIAAPAVRRMDTVETLARDRGIPVTVLRAHGSSPVERLASVIGLTDFASIYLGLLRGIDPTPIRAIDTLKAALA